MTFKITVEKIEIVKEIRRESVKLFDYTEAEKTEIRYGNPDKFIRQYEYQEFPTLIERKTEVYQQTVELFNLSEVIKAINGL